MDASDVEMVQRSRFDADEVYPLEELNEPEDSYIHKARRQNRVFALGIVGFALIMASFYGAKIFLMPEQDAGLDGSAGQQDGTVINNANNAKGVSEAMQNKKKNKDKKAGHAASTISQLANNTHAANNVDPAKAPGEQSGQSPPPTRPPAKDKDEKLAAWHETKVTKKDGVQYQILEVLKHDPTSFTEGLTYYDGKLYESVGLNKQSAILVLDENTGETLETYPMASKYFGEGLTYYEGQLLQLTYKAKKGFIYDIHNLGNPPQEFDFDTTTKEGWGFTYDEKRHELIVSDGSAFLHFWDPFTFQKKRKHQIMRLDGTPAIRINELEYWRDRVVANVWFEHVLLIINPVSGLVEKEYDFSKIWEEAGVKKNAKAEVFNGISVSSDPDVLYVTGKWWANMFKIKLLPPIDG